MRDTAFKAPIPGESLTTPKGAGAWERPHQYSDLNEALEYIFDRITKPKAVAVMVYMLKNGATCEALARGMLMEGFMQGKWSPDLALLMGRIVLVMIASVAEQAGVKGIKYTNPDRKFMDFLEKMKDAPPSVTEELEEEDIEDEPQELMKGL